MLHLNGMAGCSGKMVTRLLHVQGAAVADLEAVLQPSAGNLLRGVPLWKSRMLSSISHSFFLGGGRGINVLVVGGLMF